jgi:RNA polymerase sigma-70 factor, ECF subfamily
MASVLARRPPGRPVLVLDGGHELEDGELVRRARDGTGWALEVIYRRHVGLVATTARRLLRDPSEVDDIVHETFLIAFEKLDHLIDGDALRGWLIRIAVSRVHRRFRWRRFTTLLGGQDPAAVLAEQVSHDAGPEQRAELALIDRALARMPLRLRTPWVLRHVIGCPLEDVAAACECSLATVKRRIADAEARMRAHLEGTS